MCMKKNESMDHLFIHCSPVRSICDFFLSHLNVPWFFLNNFRDLISGWQIKDLDGNMVSLTSFDSFYPGILAGYVEREEQKNFCE